MIALWIEFSKFGVLIERDNRYTKMLPPGIELGFGRA